MHGTANDSCELSGELYQHNYDERLPINRIHTGINNQPSTNIISSTPIPSVPTSAGTFPQSHAHNTYQVFYTLFR